MGMTSYEFEIAAKNAVVEVCKNEGISITIADIHVIFLSDILGYAKTTLQIAGPEPRYFDVTYNRTKNEMYIDTYQKIANKLISGEKIQTSVKGWLPYDF